MPVSAGVADLWGRLLVQAGRPVPAINSLRVTRARYV